MKQLDRLKSIEGQLEAVINDSAGDLPPGMAADLGVAHGRIKALRRAFEAGRDP